MNAKEQIVHSDPEIMGGELVFVGTRVPVYNLFDYLDAGDSLDEFLEQFPSVSRDQAVAALELAPSVVQREWGEEIERLRAASWQASPRANHGKTCVTVSKGVSRSVDLMR